MMIRTSIIVLVNLEISLSIANITGPMWSYGDESTWPGLRCQEGGYRQSPIDIQTKLVLKDYKKRYIKYGELQFTGYQKVLLDGVNNGHTVQFSTAGEESIHPWVTGGPLRRRYRLEQLHFHWDSEHAIDGKKFPMEIHLVHVRSDLAVKEALQRKDGLAILSILCNAVFELSEEEEDRVIELMGYVPGMTQPGTRIAGVLIDLSKLLPPVESYFTYDGSLTSPQCNEVVIWIIFNTPISITKRQYNAIKKLSLGRANSRSLQPLKRHLVYRPPSASNWNTPYLVGIVTDAYSKVVNFFNDVSRYFKKDKV